MQYKLGADENGQELIPDAVVFVKEKIIPIDSKFSLENYNRIIEEKNEAEREKLEKAFVADLKMRIAETAKYIQPGQGTMDFAFMFIPHEAIYYDLIINKPLYNLFNLANTLRWKILRTKMGRYD